MIRKRLASLDDPIIHRLVVEQLVPFSRAFDASASATFTEIRKRLNRNVTFVASKGTRRPFAFITMLRKARVLFVDMLAVDPREQSRGWGQQLMNVAEAHGKTERCQTIQLLVDDSNEKAYRFYVGRGYTVKQYIPDLACYMMTKPIK
ncbi:GNAT family N-acetyltransferase [Paenibacillus sp. SYP-B3998]|uniref:GNAT family N-acetyltransferase n=1 Tax=Paenibacillus sp. SYP-B3998 TaxID=2678564 RepID=A0A6G4A880_9BACL|nr:GNAT family N-acetyltransferase [Paenibacillus sp. SYP-B3998]NEW09827.1 GNAT family N-acetyltransferase [Paenibacillus sp. SYP-B3998]